MKAAGIWFSLLLTPWRLPAIGRAMDRLTDPPAPPRPRPKPKPFVKKPAPWVPLRSPVSMPGQQYHIPTYTTDLASIFKQEAEMDMLAECRMNRIVIEGAQSVHMAPVVADGFPKSNLIVEIKLEGNNDDPWMIRATARYRTGQTMVMHWDSELLSSMKCSR